MLLEKSQQEAGWGSQVVLPNPPGGPRPCVPGQREHSDLGAAPILSSHRHHSFESRLSPASRWALALAYLTTAQGRVSVLEPGRLKLQPAAPPC